MRGARGTLVGNVTPSEGYHGSASPSPGTLQPSNHREGQGYIGFDVYWYGSNHGFAPNEYYGANKASSPEIQPCLRSTVRCPPRFPPSGDYDSAQRPSCVPLSLLAELGEMQRKERQCVIGVIIIAQTSILISFYLHFFFVTSRITTTKIQARPPTKRTLVCSVLGSLFESGTDTVNQSGYCTIPIPLFYSSNPSPGSQARFHKPGQWIGRYTGGR